MSHMNKTCGDWDCPFVMSGGVSRSPKEVFEEVALHAENLWINIFEVIKFQILYWLWSGMLVEEVESKDVGIPLTRD